MDEETSPTHQANASDCFFVFNDDECVCVCDPHLYPVGCTPSFFFSMFTNFKSDKKGGDPGRLEQLRARTPTLCCVLTLFAYFSAHLGR